MLEQELLAIPIDRWVIAQVVVTEWQDGPRRGFWKLANPPCEFAFECVDEEARLDGPARRIMKLKELSAGSIEELLAAQTELGPVLKPLWSPRWKFAAADSQRRANELVLGLESNARATDMMIATDDMIHIDACWWFATTRSTVHGESPPAPATVSVKNRTSGHHPTRSSSAKLDRVCCGTGFILPGPSDAKQMGSLVLLDRVASYLQYRNSHRHLSCNRCHD
ncbi:MAG: hypothetical protein HYR84_07730 [Planctomycetes bacterium]|nr:hypothetical protein [Planctomycetota bacterium]